MIIKIIILIVYIELFILKVFIITIIVGNDYINGSESDYSFEYINIDNLRYKIFEDKNNVYNIFF